MAPSEFAVLNTSFLLSGDIFDDRDHIHVVLTITESHFSIFSAIARGLAPKPCISNALSSGIVNFRNPRPLTSSIYE